MVKTKHKFKAKTAEEREQEIQELTNLMDEKIQSYFESPEAIREHLAFMANFHSYSERNIALMEAQFRGARAVGSFAFWKSKGVSVKKGEKGIKILAPTPVEYFNYGHNEEGKPLWKQVKYANAKEKEKLEKGLYTKKKAMFYRVGHVFEYTQTDAREKGIQVSEIFSRYHQDGIIEHDIEMLAALHNISEKLGFEVLDEPIEELGTAKGVAYPYEKAIALNPRNTTYEDVTTLIHELAHAKLHVPGVREEMTVEEREFQAEMVSYVVANRYGIDTEEFSLSYLGHWTKGKELRDKEKLLNEVRQTASFFIDEIDQHFLEADLLKDKEAEHSNRFMVIQYGSLSDATLKEVSVDELKKQVTDTISQYHESSRSILTEKVRPFLEAATLQNEHIDILHREMGNNFKVFNKNDISQPTILIQWSEHEALEDNSFVRFAEGNEKMAKLEADISNGEEGYYYKTRYHLLIPNKKGDIELINVDRLDIGDGFYDSPYRQILAEKNLTLEQSNALKNDIASYKKSNSMKRQVDLFEMER